MAADCPALTHVCIWSAEGWRPITAKEAAELHPGGTVSHRSGLFMCDLCGQSVTLTHDYGRGKQRHFKHSKHEADKNCPDRTFGYDRPAVIQIDPKSFNTHLRLIVSSNKFMLELGLLCDSSCLSERGQNITITQEGGRKRTFSADDWLIPDTVTYFPVPVSDTPSSWYNIEATGSLKSLWSTHIDIDYSDWNFFDAVTGRKLSAYPDIQVGRKYHLLTCKRLYDEHEDINVREIARNNLWRVYEVVALKLSEEAARFFLSHGGRLTDKPLNINIVWPVHIVTPYLSMHDSDYIIFHVDCVRDVSLSAFPRAGLPEQQCPSGSRIAKMIIHGRQQVIAAGTPNTANILRSIYLWRETLTRTAELPSVEVMDNMNSPLQPGECAVLPKFLTVRGRFDGAVIIRRDNITIRQYRLFSHKTLRLYDLDYGVKVSVLQGLDEVFAVSFTAPVKHDDISDGDNNLLNILQKFKAPFVPVPYYFASLYDKFSAFPKVRRWIYAAARKGIVPEAALKFLKNYIAKQGDMTK